MPKLTNDQKKFDGYSKTQALQTSSKASSSLQEVGMKSKFRSLFFQNGWKANTSDTTQTYECQLGRSIAYSLGNLQRRISTNRKPGQTTALPSMRNSQDYQDGLLRIFVFLHFKARLDLLVMNLNIKLYHTIWISTSNSITPWLLLTCFFSPKLVLLIGQLFQQISVLFKWPYSFCCVKFALNLASNWKCCNTLMLFAISVTSQHVHVPVTSQHVCACTSDITACMCIYQWHHSMHVHVPVCLLCAYEGFSTYQFALTSLSCIFWILKVSAMTQTQQCGKSHLLNLNWATCVQLKSLMTQLMPQAQESFREL